jgi:perosamine synthetase
MIPVNTPSLSGNERKYLNECIDTGWISSEGPFITRFEHDMAARVGRSYGIAVCNGSVALDAAVLALGIGPGDEVIMPTFTIISCAAAIVRAGATPVTVDCDPVTFNLTAEGVAAAITPRTKAIMVVHIYGLPCPMDPILDLCRKHNLYLIEDAAEMHGQTYKGKPCGSFGDISTFSFYPNKHVTTGEGGMVMTSDAQLAERVKSLRNLCFIPTQRFVHEELGFNYRMTNLQAALGVAQLEQLDAFVEKKRAMGKRYLRNLNGLPGVQLPVEQTPEADNIYWVFPLVCADAETKNRVVDALGKAGIGTRPFFWCMHEQPVFIKQNMFQNVQHPHAEHIARCGFYVPSGLGLTDAEIDQVSETLWTIFKS